MTRGLNRTGGDGEVRRNIVREGDRVRERKALGDRYQESATHKKR